MNNSGMVVDCEGTEIGGNVHETVPTSHHDILNVRRWIKSGHLFQRLLVDFIIRAAKGTHDPSMIEKYTNNKDGEYEKDKSN